MKFYVATLLLGALIVIVECGHMFDGTNIHRPMMYHINLPYDSIYMQKRIEVFNYTAPLYVRNVIQGILAYDLTNSGASANITAGGIGQNHVIIRMKSDTGTRLNYDIYLYA